VFIGGFMYKLVGRGAHLYLPLSVSLA